MLLEGVPGTGQDVLSLAMARLLGCPSARIKCHARSDAGRADIVGANILHQNRKRSRSAQDRFQPHLLRRRDQSTPPRTQAALLEAMQENAATVDGTAKRSRRSSPGRSRRRLRFEFEGTIDPEGERDRFMMKISIDSRGRR